MEVQVCYRLSFPGSLRVGEPLGGVVVVAAWEPLVSREARRVGTAWHNGGFTSHPLDVYNPVQVSTPSTERRRANAGAGDRCAPRPARPGQLRNSGDCGDGLCC
jgi:hypothetical protein